MSIYVRNGTPLDGPALCETCSYGLIRRGYRLGEEIALCRLTEPATRVEFRVRECTGYFDRTRPSMYRMEQIAWPISAERTKETAGFAKFEQKPVATESIELVLDDEE